MVPLGVFPLKVFVGGHCSGKVEVKEKRRVEVGISPIGDGKRREGK